MGVVVAQAGCSRSFDDSGAGAVAASGSGSRVSGPATPGGRYLLTLDAAFYPQHLPKAPRSRVEPGSWPCLRREGNTPPGRPLTAILTIGLAPRLAPRLDALRAKARGLIDRARAEYTAVMGPELALAGGSWGGSGGGVSGSGGDGFAGGACEVLVESSGSRAPRRARAIDDRTSIAEAAFGAGCFVLILVILIGAAIAAAWAITTRETSGASVTSSPTTTNDTHTPSDGARREAPAERGRARSTHELVAATGARPTGGHATGLLTPLRSPGDEPALTTETQRAQRKAGDADGFTPETPNPKPQTRPRLDRTG